MDEQAPVRIEKWCPTCGYDVRVTPEGSRCPECGEGLTAWTERWRTWFVMAGLDLLAWGLPLVVVGVMVAVYINYWRNGTRFVAIFEQPTFLFCALPVAVCLIAAVLLAVAERRYVRVVGCMSIITMVSIALACEGLPHRQWIVVQTGNVRVSSLVFGVPTIAGAVAMLGGVVVYAALARSLRRLGREVGLHLGTPLGAGVLALGGSYLSIFPDDLLTALNAPPFAPANRAATTSYSPMIPDSIRRAAAAVSLLAMWGVVLGLRARVRLDIPRVR